MLTLKKEIETFFIIIIAALVSLYFLSFKDKKRQNIISPVLPAASTLRPIPITLQTDNIESPDGLKNLIVKKEKINNMINYSFFVSDANSENKELIFEKKENTDQNLLVPFNTWSPNNAYFFLIEEGDTKNYYIFYSADKVFSNNEKYLNVQELFSKKLPSYKIVDVTGWADPNLLIINTKLKNGEKGPSFWFEVSSRSFIQLATHFY